MRIMYVTLAALVMFLASCTQIHPIPPQTGGEPKEITVSQLAAEMGWTYKRDFENDQYIVKGPTGNQMSFQIGSDLVGIEGSRWRMERDAYYTGWQQFDHSRKCIQLYCSSLRQA